MPWLGFVPDDVASAPPVAVAQLAERLGVDPGELGAYGRRDQTRSDHLRLVAGYLGWKTAPATSTVAKELEQFLLDRAMEHDSPTLLFNLATEYLMAIKTIGKIPEGVRKGIVQRGVAVICSSSSATRWTGFAVWIS